MNDLIQSILEGKRARRRELAALPVGEKLRMLEQMIADTRAIAATRPVKTESPIRIGRGAK